MFQATMCPSSGETTVFMRHLLFVVTLYGWLSGMQGAYQSSIQNNKYQVSHKYSCFFWWWAHSWPKHVEKRNKHTKKNCAPSWLYIQYYTGMHGQQNIKKKSVTVFRDSILQRSYIYKTETVVWRWSSTHLIPWPWITWSVASLERGPLVQLDRQTARMET